MFVSYTYRYSAHNWSPLARFSRYDALFPSPVKSFNEFNIVFHLGEATAAEIVERLPEPSSNSYIRILLGILEEKGP